MIQEKNASTTSYTLPIVTLRCSHRSGNCSWMNGTETVWWSSTRGDGTGITKHLTLSEWVQLVS